GRKGDWPRGRCSSVTCPGHRAGNTCPARLSGYVRQPEVKGVSIVIILILSDAPWRYYLRQEPDAAIPHVRIRAGGRPRGRFLPRQVERSGTVRVACMVGKETAN